MIDIIIGLIAILFVSRKQKGNEAIKKLEVETDTAFNALEEQLKNQLELSELYSQLSKIKYMSPEWLNTETKIAELRNKGSSLKKITEQAIDNIGI